MIGSKGATLVALAAALVASTNAACHQNCNGHGTCGQYDRCTCYHGWDHVNAEDCSQRVCPYGQAWASISENVHKYAECSNQGNCNRETGECECNEGFTGHSCQRSSCPNSCSGHGQCQTLKTWETTYSAWDADKIMACKCDPGYDSADCSTRKCPLGDDPLSTEAADSFQVITFDVSTAVGEEFALKFTDWTGQVHTTHRIELVASCESNAHLVQEALVAIPNNVIPTVEVGSSGAVDPGNSACALTVTFTANENTGDVEKLGFESGSDDLGAQPLISTPLVMHDSNPDPLLHFPAIVVTRGDEESKVCSGRGICNSELGLCQCHVGFYGHSCNKQTALQ